MYVHPKFAIDREEALGLAESIGFGLLVAFDGKRPMGAHLPFLVSKRAPDDTRIEFHVARNNPIAALADGEREFMMAVQGPDTYVSPDWYASPDQVSTWLYEAVHLKGPVRVTGPDTHLDHADRLSAVFENRLLPKKPWTSGKMDAARRTMMLGGIIGMEMQVMSVEGQRKLNQHKGDADHLAIVRALGAQSDPEANEIASKMQALRPALNETGLT
jgi:transcriptional regulator